MKPGSRTINIEGTRRLPVNIVLVLSLLALGYVISSLMSADDDRIADDSSKIINPKECGQVYHSMRGKRFISGAVSNQRDWAWQVCIFDSGMRATGGSLINSQWVLTRAKFLEFAFSPPPFCLLPIRHNSWLKMSSIFVEEWLRSESAHRLTRKYEI